MKTLLRTIIVAIRKLIFALRDWVVAPLMRRHYTKWYRWQFLIVPYRQSWHIAEKDIDAIVIIPLKHLHDSGWRCMDFVAIREDKPVCRLSGCSDVIHLGGIGGFGKWYEGMIPGKVEPIDWGIDSLERSGLLRVFCYGKLEAGSATSSFELFAKKES